MQLLNKKVWKSWSYHSNAATECARKVGKPYLARLEPLGDGYDCGHGALDWYLTEDQDSMLKDSVAILMVDAAGNRTLIKGEMPLPEPEPAPLPHKYTVSCRIEIDGDCFDAFFIETLDGRDTVFGLFMDRVRDGLREVKSHITKL